MTIGFFLHPNNKLPEYLTEKKYQLNTNSKIKLISSCMIACILYNYYGLLMLSNWNYRYDWNKWIKRNAFVIYLCANSFNLILRDYNILSKTIYKHHSLALIILLSLGVFCCVFYTHTIQCRGLRAAIKIDKQYTNQCAFASWGAVWIGLFAVKKNPNW